MPAEVRGIHTLELELKAVEPRLVGQQMLLTTGPSLQNLVF